MTEPRRNALVLNVLVIAVTIVFVATALLVGRPESAEPLALSVGDLAPERVEAPFFITVEDEDATEQARTRAANNVEAIYRLDLSVNREVQIETQRLFAKIDAEARLSEGELPLPDDDAEESVPPSADFTVTCEELVCTFDGSTSTAANAEVVDYAWDFGDGDQAVGATIVHTYELAGSYPVSLSVRDSLGGTDSTLVTLVVPGAIVIPTTTPPTTVPPTTTTTLPLRERDDHLARVLEDYARIGDAVEMFVDAYREDVARAELGQPQVYESMRSAVESQIADRLDIGIIEGTLDNVRNDLALNPPPVFLQLGFIEDPAERVAYQAAVDEAVAEVVSDLLRANQLIDTAAWDEAQQAAADGVEPVLVQYVAGQPIVEEGSRITGVQLEALTSSGYLDPSEGESRVAVAAVGAIAVLLTAFFLWRIAPVQWSEPRRFALLGVLLVLAALVSRIPEVVTQENAMLGYVIPAVMFGYMAAILYDPRTAVLLSVPVSVFTAVSYGDAALTIYAGAATVAPVAFVSSVSSRRDLRVAVASSAAVLAPLAASIAWLFTGPGEADARLVNSVFDAALFGVIGGVVAGLVAQGLLSFLENLFRVTTTITLLDLTDRNHPALRLIEEQAPGTFNHSILVGTLAGKAARAIGADPLLAQAAAFYHDLGKTKQPQFFIENQFGVSNPHDALPPPESAVIISDHVTEGLRLARQFRLPPEVVNGIRQHHGTGLMRYFYHKALDEDPAVDPKIYRHRGEKPKAKEMAILMIADACEGAARAMAQQEDPTGDSLRKLVESIVNEKLEDGQLDESDLTYGDLTKVKIAIVDSLIGYYHTRIPYPGFPGPRTPE
jgi:putative nucleotidyltransferase with HDIG domain